MFLDYLELAQKRHQGPKTSLAQSFEVIFFGEQTSRPFTFVSTVKAYVQTLSTPFTAIAALLKLAGDGV